MQAATKFNARWAMWGVLGCLAAAGAPAWAAEPDSPTTESPTPLGKAIADFQLKDFRGKEWSLADFRDKKCVVVVFLGTECPLVKMYAGRLVELARDYESKGVAVLGINSNQQDSLAKLTHFAQHHKIDFPLLKDPGNKVADQFGAQRTPEAFLLDAERRVRYWGAIDDQYSYGLQRPAALQQYLRAALDEALAGKPVSRASVDPKGCHIGRVLKPDESSPVTYSKHIAPILNARCVNCHRPGEIGPFALQTYDDVVGWSEMIAEVVSEERMPPWHANPAHGKFANDVRLTTDEKDLIYQWVEAGAPEGNRDELPPPPQFVEGWQIGRPDQVVYMAERPFRVPARGEVKYQYFVVDPGFTEDKWIKAAECRPGNRMVVHHIIVGVVYPGGPLERAAQDGLGSEWLTATAPGARPLVLPDGHAKRVPKGAKLVFQMHYTPNGTPQEDRSSVGLTFADPLEVKYEVSTRKAATRRLEIPPGAANHRVEATYTATRDQTLLAMFPHMHLRGKSFRYTAIFPNGRREILLDVPRYDFNWQNSYVPAKPIHLPAGTRVHCEAAFDNSAENFANPDPTATVRWGDQTWEEMMIGYFDAAVPRAPLRELGSPRTEKFLATAKEAGEPPAALRRVATGAARTELGMTRLGLALRNVAPQIDRACLVVIEGDQLEVRRVVQVPGLIASVGGQGLKTNVQGMALPRVAAGEQTIVHAELSRQPEKDLEHMAKAFGSSLHVPVRWQGKPATINFWSREENAFPPVAVKLLEPLAREMARED